MCNAFEKRRTDAVGGLRKTVERKTVLGDEIHCLSAFAAGEVRPVELAQIGFGPDVRMSLEKFQCFASLFFGMMNAAAAV